jgi:hypothetical protein
MAKASTTTIEVEVSGDGVTCEYTPSGAPIENSAAPAGGPVTVSLSSGNNAVTVPTGAVAVLIVPSTGSTVAKKLKGDNADTGFGIRPSAPSLISLVASASTVIINAASAEDISIFWL